MSGPKKSADELVASARAEVTRIAELVAVRDARIAELEQQLATHRPSAVELELEQARETIGRLRQTCAKLRGAARAANSDALELLRAALPIVRSRIGLTQHAATMLGRAVDGTLATVAERKRNDPELAAEVGMHLLDELVAGGR